MKKIKKFGVLLFVALAAAVLLTACGKDKIITYDANDYLDVSFSGNNGSGVAEVIMNSSFNDRINSDLYGGNGTAEQVFEIQAYILDAVSYNIDGNSTGLSNGDEVTVSLTADNDKLKEHGIQFTDSTATFKVSGLGDSASANSNAENNKSEENNDELVELDVFEGLSVTYSGNAPKGKAWISYEGDNDFIKNNVNFSADNSSNLSNGDVIVITAKCNEDILANNGYKITNSEKSFTVKGLEYYPDNLGGYDLTEIDAMIYEPAYDELVSMGYGIGDSRLITELLANEGKTGTWTITSETMSPAKKFVYYKADRSYSQYIIYYDAAITAENQNGENADTNIYVVGGVHEIKINSDGEIAVNEGNTFHYSDVYIYIGMTLEEAIEDYSTNSIYASGGYYEEFKEVK